ncbi:carboxypeptidase regulatory-like domain-containing protein [Marilutibacter chinensis]|uniref:Carboxypeptidase regulatory-like domain-containing protein n=1 Tax=Marilutibacter chinensis TaxID=2912247 RepID=A0ABS9HWC4_9GAMM|nr:carboxypeptidase regulatory-like domain-containing protein [Lysobacter chinensis]MCF7221196.1 carboxypeptidase regulatory-like domain-containing protein [Lysobacter chinensis]MCF7223063.1 carboxypeptidase regulatory-like domain-containing protein [Lysobacter chinensis]
MNIDLTNEGLAQGGLVALLALAVVIAWARLLSRQWRGPARSHGWRLALLLALQPLCALLLYRTLVPPPVAVRSGTLTVLTAGASRVQLATSEQGEVLVALPEVPVFGDAEAVPDLATALRRHPGTARIHVVGAGLDARDLTAVEGFPLVFDPAPLPTGVTGLWLPDEVAAGDVFTVSGRVNGVEGGSVELIDPAGQRVDDTGLEEDGAFTLDATVRAPGIATFALRVRDAAGEPVETLDVPLSIADAPAPRVLLMAGAPNPELRALRRWAEDAGMALHAQLAVGGGVQLGDPPSPMDAETLRGFDLVVLDERAWASLGETRRTSLLAAVREGLGVLLRATGPLSRQTREQLAALGLPVSAGTGTVALALPHSEGLDEATLRARLGNGSEDAPLDVELAAAPPPRLLRRDLRIGTDAAVPVSGIAGSPWLYWRAEGRGRIGITTLVDSYRLPLSGRGDLHGELWSTAFATVARAAGMPPRFEADPREGVRTRICAVADDAMAVAPDGTATPLLIDPLAGPGRCAGYWPRTPGWHRLRQGADSWPFFVRAAGAAPGLRAAERRDRTLQRVGDVVLPPAATRDTGATAARRGASWPWFLAWVASIAALWGLERWRRGIRMTG